MPPKMKSGELKRLLVERWNYPSEKKSNKIRFFACGKSPNYGIPQLYEPCWKCPIVTNADTSYGPCWDYPSERYKRRPLPPPCRGSVIPPDLLVPNFNQCQTLYTRCDFRLEECVHQQILYVEHLFRNLEIQFSQAKSLQMELAKKMHYQAIRRRLLLGSACGIKIYPEYLSQMAENRALCDFQKAHNAINNSNTELSAAVLEVRNAMQELRIRLDKLDHTIDSPFMADLEKVLQTIQDVYDYFFELVRKYKTWAELIDAGQEQSIDDYLALFRTEQDFESFKSAGTENCTCFRCKYKNPLETRLPCWCQGCNPRKESIKLVQPERMLKPELDSTDSGFLNKQSDTSLLQTELS